MEAHGTESALVGPNAQVDLPVGAQVGPVSESLGTLVALVGAFAGVHGNVPEQRGLPRECLEADGALEPANVTRVDQPCKKKRKRAINNDVDRLRNDHARASSETTFHNFETNVLTYTELLKTRRYVHICL